MTHTQKYDPEIRKEAIQDYSMALQRLQEIRHYFSLDDLDAIGQELESVGAHAEEQLEQLQGQK